MISRREAGGRLRNAPLGRGRVLAVTAALGAVLVAGAVAAAVSSGDGSTGAAGRADASRLRTLESNRYDYWRVALGSFADHPLAGTGTSGFRVDWQRERGRRDAANDAHSLYLETLAELGLVGLALLAAFLAGVFVSARRALARSGALAAGTRRGARGNGRSRGLRLGLGAARGRPAGARAGGVARRARRPAIPEQEQAGRREHHERQLGRVT